MKIIEKIKKGLKNFSTMLDKVDVPNEDNSKLLADYPDLMMASSNADSFAKSIEYRPEKQKRSNQSNISIKGIAKNEISKNDRSIEEKNKKDERIEENQRER